MLAKVVKLCSRCRSHTQRQSGRQAQDCVAGLIVVVAALRVCCQGVATVIEIVAAAVDPMLLLPCGLCKFEISKIH